MNSEHPVQQPIEHIIVCLEDHQLSIDGIRYRVGENGVTRIEATIKSGTESYIPYLRVWRGDEAVAEFCQHRVFGVFFAPSPAMTEGER